MLYFHWIFLLLYVLIIVASMLTVLMDNRQPAKTMAWMMVLVFLPVVGIILYFFFGQNTRKEKMISENSLDQLTKRTMFEYVEQKNLTIPEEHRTLVKQFTLQNWAFPFKDNSVDIFTDGYQMFHALLRDISKATHHIHLDTYIFADDALGNLIADALMERAKAGVEVRVVYDDVGCWKVDGAFFERMREAGIDVHAFMPVKFPAFTSKVNYRNHRKLCVIDGLTGYIGGMNIATRYVKGRQAKNRSVGRASDSISRTATLPLGEGQGERPTAPPSPWRDTHLRIRGASVYGIQRAFLVDWYFVDRTLITNRKYYPPLTSEGICNPRHFSPLTSHSSPLIQIVTSSPITPWPDIMQGYVRILLEAKHYVYIETPYFLPTEPVFFAMQTAVLAGVDVRLMVPYTTDTRLVEWASRSYVRQAAETGVKVYLYKTGFNHSKLLVTDDNLCTVGSTNVDFRSFENNFEGNAFICDHDIALQMKAIFETDMSNSILYDDLEQKKRPAFVERFLESIVRLLSPLL